MNKIISKKKFLIITLFVLMLLAFGYQVYQYFFHADVKTIVINNTISSINEINYQNEITNLKNENGDIIGILEIPNTDFKRVFVQTSDNTYYLKRNINKEPDKNGTPFLDYRTNINSNKLIIYGHNSKYADMPFNYLMNYYDKDFFEKNKYIEIKTDKEIMKYEVFSIFTETKDWSYTDVEFKDNKDFINNIESLKQKSIYKNDFDINNKQILVLQTCSTKKEYSKYKRKFLVIVAGRVN